MRKGISNLVAVILLMLISVSLVASLYIWSTANIFEVYPEEQYNRTYLRSRACLSIEDIRIAIDRSRSMITLRNCGYVPLSEFQLYINMLPVDSSFQDKLEPSESAIMIMGIIPESTDKVYVTADFAESEILTVG